MPDKPDEGASPHLRRSSRKRKSTAGEADMPKDSSSKKKRNSTGNKTSTTMPRVPRSPVSDNKAAGQQASTLETLLAGMEGKLGLKIDSTNNKVEKALTLVAETNTALEELELKVAATEAAIEKRLAEAEARLQVRMAGQVKNKVLDQLRVAGIDPDLTAGALTRLHATSQSVVTSNTRVRPSCLPVGPSYAMEASSML